MILGTAGHVDHGKTALVRALTGVDTDRLPEERRRGISIELGFAPLDLPAVGRVGVVDVPGHEALVRTMVAGATGMDAAVLVVAADEGAMPQTREHLAVLDLLGVPRLVVALTKCDLVDDDWLALVEEDVRALLAASGRADAPCVRVSARTGAGLEALRAVLAATLAASSAAALAGAPDDERQAEPDEPPRGRSAAPARLPVDRAFTRHGTGTVVTGTLWSGMVAVDDELVVQPLGRRVRVRGVQVHGEAVTRAASGSRVAVALVGIAAEEVERGATLVAHPEAAPTRLLRVDLRLLPGERPPSSRAAFRLHLGTSEVAATVVGGAERLVAGEGAVAARLRLEAPVVAQAGDRFVLRGGPAARTVGGGMVTDAHPPLRRAATFAAPGLPVAARLAHALDEAGWRGLAAGAAGWRFALDATALAAAADRCAGRRHGDRLYAGALVDRGVAAVAASVERALAADPLAAGAPVAAVRVAALRAAGAPAALVGSPAAGPLAALALEEACARRGLAVVQGMVAPDGWRPSPTPAERTALDRILQMVADAALEPLSDEELAARVGADAPRLLRHLGGTGALVRIEGRWWGAAVLAGAVDRLRHALAGDALRSAGELREALGMSRRFAIALLEWADAERWTAREGDRRRWRGAGALPAAVMRPSAAPPPDRPRPTAPAADG